MPVYICKQKGYFFCIFVILSPWRNMDTKINNLLVYTILVGINAYICTLTFLKGRSTYIKLIYFGDTIN